MKFHRARPLRNRPLVSVVVPCYNYGHFLADAVRSAMDQPGVDVEVIIVDDASVDDSLKVARRIAAADPRVRVLSHPVNLGHIRTYNDGLALATGTYVVLLSADDLLVPGSLTRAAALLEAFPHVALAYGYYREFSDVPPRADQTVHGWTIWPGEEWVEQICRRGRNLIASPEAVLRRTVAETIGGYEPDQPHAGDMSMWMRAALHGDVGRVNGPDQAFYRVHGANMHLKTYDTLLRDSVQRQRVFDTFFEGEGQQLRRPHRLLRRARRALALEALWVACLALGEADGRGELTEPQALASFALKCSPQVEGSVIWHEYSRRLKRNRRPGFPVRALRAFYDLRWSLRWRRWRRFGT